LALTEGSGEQGELVIRPQRRSEAILSRLLAAPLDRRLGAGEPPERTSLLATRARYLVSERGRLEAAEAWAGLLDKKSGGGKGRRLPVPSCSERIAAARSEIGELISLLESPRPVAARGVATANCVLADGTGPLWSRLCPVDLGDVIRRGIAQLTAPMFDEGASLHPV